MDSQRERAFRTWLESLRGTRERFEVSLIVGGRSNVSYRVDHGDDRFVLRRPPYGAVLDGAHDVLREFRLIQALESENVPVARPVGACEDPNVLGAPFTLVGFLNGATLRSAEDVAALSDDARRRVTHSFAETLARLHQVDPERVGRSRTSGLEHADRQLRVWTQQLLAGPHRPLPLLNALGEHLRSRRPEQRQVAIVHGDYRLDNVIVGHDGEIAGVLDWELWTLGDPVLDVGNALAYWTESAFELFPLGTSPTAGGVLGTRDDLLAAYLAAGSRDLAEDSLAWAISFGFWRYAIILEGVYRRNLAGAYGDVESEEWRRFEHVVPVMAEIGWQLRPR